MPDPKIKNKRPRVHTQPAPTAVDISTQWHTNLSVEVFHLEPLTTENSGDMAGSDPRD
jgi:hypothetical protein